MMHGRKNIKVVSKFDLWYFCFLLYSLLWDIGLICLVVKKLTWRLLYLLELFILIPEFIFSNVKVMYTQTEIGLCIFVNG